MAKSNLELLLFKVFRGKESFEIRQLYADKNYTQLQDLLDLKIQKNEKDFDENFISSEQYFKRDEDYQLLRTELGELLESDTSDKFNGKAKSFGKSKHILDE